MSTRIDRFKAAVILAQTILEDDEQDDDLKLQQAMDDIVDEVRAGRRNQAEWPSHAARAIELIGQYSHRVDPLPVTYLHQVREENA